MLPPITAVVCQEVPLENPKEDDETSEVPVLLGDGEDDERLLDKIDALIENSDEEDSEIPKPLEDDAYVGKPLDRADTSVETTEFILRVEATLLEAN